MTDHQCKLLVGPVAVGTSQNHRCPDCDVPFNVTFEAPIKVGDTVDVIAEPGDIGVVEHIESRLFPLDRNRMESRLIATVTIPGYTFESMVDVRKLRKVTA